MLELLALLLSAFALLFKSTERLGAKNLVVPTENLILYDQRGLLKRPVSVPDLQFFLRPVPGAISVSSLKICCRRILGTCWRTGRW
jgi:hypothetical protein